MRKEWTGNITSLDLELNQADNNPKIIQIGAVVGNVYTGEIIERISVFVNPREILVPRIIELTGITQDQVDTAGTLLDAYRVLSEAHTKHNSLLNPITWGGGDSDELRKQLGEVNEPWVFGRRWVDVKTLFVSRQIALNRPWVGGLAKSLTKVGLNFKGRKHNALDDAYNTFVMYRKLLEDFKAREVPDLRGLVESVMDLEYVPCKHGHCFTFSSNTTNSECPPDQVCMCGAVKYGDIKK